MDDYDVIVLPKRKGKTIVYIVLSRYEKDSIYYKTLQANGLTIWVSPYKKESLIDEGTNYSLRIFSGSETLVWTHLNLAPSELEGVIETAKQELLELGFTPEKNRLEYSGIDRKLLADKV